MFNKHPFPINPYDYAELVASRQKYLDKDDAFREFVQKLVDNLSKDEKADLSKRVQAVIDELKGFYPISKKGEFSDDIVRCFRVTLNSFPMAGNHYSDFCGLDVDMKFKRGVHQPKFKGTEKDAEALLERLTALHAEAVEYRKKREKTKHILYEYRTVNEIREALPELVPFFPEPVDKAAERAKALKELWGL